MRMVSAIVLFAAFLVAGVAAAAEVQVPLDRSGRVQRVDQRLAQRLGLFEDRPGFQEARLFLLPDSSFVLEITSLQGARLALVRERVPLTRAGADSVRDLVTRALAARPTPMMLDPSGRPLLITLTTLMGLGFYGWAVPVVADVSSAETFTGLYLLTAGASMFLPMILTQDQNVSDASALMWFYGASRGTVHGALAPYLMSEDPEGTTQISSALAFSLAEGVGGYAWASRSRMRAGSAGTLVTGGDTGMLFGLGFASFADAKRSGMAAASLAGTALGLAGANALDAHRDYSYGDAGVMRMAEYVGAYAGTAVAVLADIRDDGKAVTASAMTGASLGLVVGDAMVRNTDFTFGQSVLVNAGSIAGGLLGLGVGFLAIASNSSSSGDSDGKVLVTASSIGTLVGFGLSYGSIAESARRAAIDRSSWRLDLAPSPPERRGGVPGVTLAVHVTLP